MRRILRPFPWALLGHLCLGIVLAPLLAILLGLTAVALPLAVFTPAASCPWCAASGRSRASTAPASTCLLGATWASRCPPRRRSLRP